MGLNSSFIKVFLYRGHLSSGVLLLTNMLLELVHVHEYEKKSEKLCNQILNGLCVFVAETRVCCLHMAVVVNAHCNECKYTN